MKAYLGIAVVVVLVLSGCGMKTSKNLPENKVGELTEQAFLINESKKEFMANLSQEAVEDLMYQIKDKNAKLIHVDEDYDTITEGLTDDKDGKRVSCYKLPVEFSFSGDAVLIKEFLQALGDIDSKVVVNKFELTENEPGYDVDCLVCFIGESAKNSVGGSSNSLSLVKKDKTVKEEEEVVLREADVNLTIRPSNSDAAAVTLSTEAKNALYYDENKAVAIKTIFYQEGNNYYCNYSVGDNVQTDKITVGKEVKFDILSCKRKLDEDKVSVDLMIENKLSQSINVVLYKDADKRVSITKSGDVEVSKK